MAGAAGGDHAGCRAELDRARGRPRRLYQGGVGFTCTAGADVLGAAAEYPNSALHTRWNGQLYTVLGEEAEGGRWQLRLWWKPFVPLIWLGGLLVALGVVLAAGPGAGRPQADCRAPPLGQPPRWSESMTAPTTPRWTLWLPLALFAMFVVLVVLGLVIPKNTDIASKMVGKPLPAFDLRAAADGRGVEP